MLNTNDVILISSIIYKIYTAKDTRTMRMDFMKQMARILNYDSATFYIAKEPGSAELYDGLKYNLDEGELQDYVDTYQYMNISHDFPLTGRNFVYRHSELMPEEERIRSEYYKTVYEPRGWHYSIHIVLGYESTYVGLFSAWRKKDKPDFSEDEKIILDVLKNHLAYVLYQDLIKTSPAARKARTAAKPYKLTTRETEILNALLDGARKEDLCDTLFISPHTLKKHLSNIYRKTGVGSMQELIRKFSSGV